MRDARYRVYAASAVAATVLVAWWPGDEPRGPRRPPRAAQASLQRPALSALSSGAGVMSDLPALCEPEAVQPEAIAPEAIVAAGALATSTSQLVIRGRVLAPDGRGHVGAEVVVHGDQEDAARAWVGAELAHGRSGPDGAFVLELALRPDQQVVALVATAEGFGLAACDYRVDATRPPPLVTLRLAPERTLEGVVTDLDGVGVMARIVATFQEPHPPGEVSAGANLTTHSAASGHFRLEGLPAGAFSGGPPAGPSWARVSLQVWREGFEAWESEVLCGPAGPARVEARLVPVDAISGVVRTPDGAPIADAEVKARGLEGLAVLTVSCDALGRFAFRDVPARTSLTVTAPDHLVTQFEVDRPGFAELVLEPEGGTIEGRVRGLPRVHRHDWVIARTNPAAAGTIAPAPTNGVRRLAPGREWEWSAQARVGADGRFVMRNVPAECEVMLAFEGAAGAVARAGARDVELEWQGETSLRLRVVASESGAPADEAEARRVGVDGSHAAFWASGTYPPYVIVPSGPLTLLFTAPGRRPELRSYQLAPGPFEAEPVSLSRSGERLRLDLRWPDRPTRRARGQWRAGDLCVPISIDPPAVPAPPPVELPDLLPPGEVELWLEAEPWTVAEGATPPRRVTARVWVEAGGTRTLALDLR